MSSNELLINQTSQVPSVSTYHPAVPSVCQFDVINVLWKRRRRTGCESECPRLDSESLVQSRAVVRVGEVHDIRVQDASGCALIILDVEALFQGGIALWNGGLIRNGVSGGMDISIDYAFRSLDKAQFFEALFGVTDIWYQRGVIVTRARVVSERASKCRTAYLQESAR